MQSENITNVGEVRFPTWTMRMSHSFISDKPNLKNTVIQKLKRMNPVEWGTNASRMKPMVTSNLLIHENYKSE